MSGRDLPSDGATFPGQHCYRNMRQDYESRVIQPYIQEAVKSTTANFDAEELITQRPQVKEELQNLMAERLAPLGIVEKFH